MLLRGFPGKRHVRKSRDNGCDSRNCTAQRLRSSSPAPHPTQVDQLNSLADELCCTLPEQADAIDAAAEALTAEWKALGRATRACHGELSGHIAIDDFFTAFERPLV